MGETVLITGVSGFIAKHIALALLQEGYRVRGTVRSAARAEQTSGTLEAAGADVSRLSFVEADLTGDEGWAEAVAGCSAVLNVASPFPQESPKDREALVPAARDGALRVLTAALAADVPRFVQTSSLAAMAYRANRPSVVTIGEDDWTDPEWSKATAYVISKTRAEKAVWEAADKANARDRIVTVNPGLVLGPTLDDRLDTSVLTIAQLMRGAYPVIPPFAFPIVDVRDVAAVHLAAVRSTRVSGRRLMAAADTLSYTQMMTILRRSFPHHAKKIPHFTPPDAVIRIGARFDPKMLNLVPDLGITPVANSSYATELTGVAFRSGEDSLLATARSLIDRHLVD